MESCWTMFSNSLGARLSASLLKTILVIGLNFFESIPLLLANLLDVVLDVWAPVPAHMGMRNMGTWG